MRLRLQFDGFTDSAVPNVRIAPSVFVPRAFTAIIETDENDHVVRLDIEVRDGRPECCAVHIERGEDAPQLSGDECRRLPVTSWVEQATTRAAIWATSWERAPVREGKIALSEVPWASEDDVKPGVAKAVRRQVPLTDERLEEVAFAYRQAHGVAAEVGPILNVSRAQAYRLIAAARERGILTDEDG